MPDIEIEPTYIGKNEGLVFVVPTELFKMKPDSEQKVEFSHRYNLQKRKN